MRRNDTPIETPPHTVRQGIREWARREPALAARLGLILACSVIRWGYLLVAGRFAPLLPSHPASQLREHPFLGKHLSIEALIDWMNQAILVGWGLASWGFQRQLNRNRKEGGLQIGWRIVDVVAIAALIQLDDALMSPLTVAFAVLIVASGFWARADDIFPTMLLSMLAYLTLVVAYRFIHPGLDRPYRHFHYLVALGLLGLMLVHQANRTQALARSCGATNPE